MANNPLVMGFNGTIPHDQMGQMGSPQPQIPPELQHVGDVLSQYIQSKQQQTSGNGLTEQILADRFQPKMQDISQSIGQTQQAYGAPDIFKPATPYDAANSRMANELAPYTSMAEIQQKLGSGQMGQMGGATGVLANRIMQDARANGQPMNFTQALQMAQTGFRQNTMMDAQGNIVNMPNALNVLSQQSNARQTGQNTSDLAYKPQIAGGEAEQRQQAELRNAAGIEQQKKIGAGEITDVQKRQSGQQQLSSTVDDMINKYKQLQGLGGTTSTQNTMGQNMMATAKNSSLGQGIQRMVGTQEQSVRNQINMGIPALINDIRATTGMSAKAMDSNAELQFYLQMATNPQVDVQSNLNALENIRRKYLSATPGIPQMDEGALSAPAQGGNPLPPSPGQLNQQGATHKYNPATGMLEQF